MSDRRPSGRTPEDARDNVVSWERSRFRQALPKVAARCMSFSAMTCFDASLVAAVYRFYGLEVDVATAEAEILEDEAERVRFFPWLLWDWREDERLESIGERFGREAEVSAHERRLVDGLNASYVGFYEVVERDEDAVRLVDLATEAAVIVADEALAEDVVSGQILQARLVRLGPEDGDLAFVDAVYAVLPSEARPAVKLELESAIGDSSRPEQRLKAYAPELLDFADHLLDTLALPPPAINDDGDDLVLTRLTLDAHSGRAVLDTLVAGAPGFELIVPALWVAAGPEIHGFVDARGPQRVVIAANSPRRHAALCAHLEGLSGDTLPRLKSLEDFGRAVPRWVEHGGGDPWLTVDQDVRAAVRGWFASWARQWLDMPLAALGDRTPREAVRQPTGRARVEAMMTRFEDLLLGELGAISSLSLDLMRSELGLEGP